MRTDYFWPARKKSPGLSQGRGFRTLSLRADGLVALTKQLQQQGEEVDEVQIERQCADNGGSLRHVAAGAGIAVDIIVLQPLGIPGREAGEYQHADDRHEELQRRTGEEQIDQARDDDAEQAHQQERAHTGEVTSRGVAIQAQRTEGCRRNEEYPHY